jgi:hypothetical protein
MRVAKLKLESMGIKIDRLTPGVLNLAYPLSQLTGHKNLQT